VSSAMDPRVLKKANESELSFLSFAVCIDSYMDSRKCPGHYH